MPILAPCPARSRHADGLRRRRAKPNGLAGIPRLEQGPVSDFRNPHDVPHIERGGQCEPRLRGVGDRVADGIAIGRGIVNGKTRIIKHPWRVCCRPPAATRAE